MADSTVKPDDTNDLVLQNNHGASKIEVNEDDTIVVTSGGNFTIDATGDIILDAGGADVTLKDGGVVYGYLKQASGHLVIQPTSSKEIILNDQAGTASLTVDTSDQNVSINNGSIVISTAGQGITFGGDPDTRQSGTTEGDRTLYDYEEGTWTPVMTSGGETISFSAISATYTKIGRTVHINFSAHNATTSGTTGGDSIQISGIPFASPSGTRECGTVVHGWGLQFSKVPNATVISNGSSNVSCFHQADASNYENINVSAVGAGSYFGFSLTYRVA